MSVTQHYVSGRLLRIGAMVLTENIAAGAGKTTESLRLMDEDGTMVELFGPPGFLRAVTDAIAETHERWSGMLEVMNS